MFRYMVLLWDPRREHDSDAVRLMEQRLIARSKQWSCVASLSGFRVWCADPRAGRLEARILSHNAGVILGTIFETNADQADGRPAESAKLSDDAVRALLKSSGRSLIESFWGNYVAILRDPRSSRVSVVKDPTGPLPCLHARLKDIHVLFSCIADIATFDGFNPTPNWAFVLDRALWTGSPTTHPALNGIAEVSRGERLTIDPTHPAQSIHESLWSPVSFIARGQAIVEPAAAARALVGTLVSCMHTQSRGHANLLLRLSGGLDSSIVLGCLKDAPHRPQITSLTYYSPGGRADARSWARLAAQDAGCNHVERLLDPTRVHLEDMLKSQRLWQPGWIIGDMQAFPIEKSLADEANATAVFTGDGGDCGLGAISTGASVRQYLAHRGFDTGLLRIAYYAAVCQDLSIWRIFGRTLKQSLLGSQSADVEKANAGACTLVTQAARSAHQANAVRALSWFSADDHVPESVLKQLGNLILAPKFYNAFAAPDETVPERVEPMYSQPAVELFLRIPAFVQIHTGRERGLARWAFRGRVPAELLDRVWKDRAPQFFTTVIERNRSFVREMLLDGILVANDILDRAALEDALSDAPSKIQHPEGELLSHLDVEIWLRRWAGSDAVRAVA